MEYFLLILELAIVLVSDFPDALCKAGFFLGDFGKWGCGIVKVLSEPLDLIFEWLGLSG